MGNILHDLNSNIKVEEGLSPLIDNIGVETKNGVSIDRKGYGAVEFIVAVGAAGDTHCTTVNHKIYLQGSADDATWTAITSAYDQLGTWEDYSTGLYKTIDANAECGVTYNFGYSGSYTGHTYRYLRVVLVGSAGNSAGTNVSVVAVLGNPTARATA